MRKTRMDQENDIFMSFGDGDEDPFLIQRIDSNEIIYCPPKRKYKLIGNKYVVGDKLGEGSYGKVKECLDKDTLERRAVKIMKRKTLRRIPNGDQNVQREIRLLKRLRHKNVISLLDVFHNEEKGKIYMVMDFCVTGLQEMLDRTEKKKFPISQAHRYFVQLVDGLEYLHSRGVIHKDIKPGNLLLDTDATLKISDFGVAEQLESHVNEHITTSQGSPLFQPPEVAGGARLFPGFKVDVWSAGCTLYNITSGKYPFEGENMFRLFENICEKPLVVPSELDPVLTSLLEGMLEKDPYKRISLGQVKSHDWCLKKHSPSDEEEPIGGDDNRHTISILPYLRSHYYESESEEELITEHQLNESRNRAELGSETSVSEISGGGGDASNRNAKQKRRKPTSCISVKSLASCKQS